MRTFILFMLLASSAQAVTLFLSSEEVRGNKRYCYYGYNGTVLTVPLHDMCPRKVQG